MKIDNSFCENGKPSSAPAIKADVRIATELRRRVARLTPGTLLPSVRDLSAEFVASPVTVQRAMAQLAREGLVLSRPGDGTYVAERAKESPRADSSWQLTVLGPATDPIANAVFELPKPGTLVLGSGYTDVSLQPLALLAK